MLEQRCNILDLIGQVNAVCITTNGSTNSKGEAIMGAGVAKSFKERYPGLPAALGALLRECGHIVQPLFVDRGTTIFSFPTKPGDTYVHKEEELIPKFRNTRKVGTIVQGWMLQSNLPLIETSTVVLKSIADAMRFTKVALPRPGCANGGLNWNIQVKPLLSKYLDNRFIICYL